MNDSIYRFYTTLLDQGTDIEKGFKDFVNICNELTALLHLRSKYHDRKIFTQDGKYIKPYDIKVIENYHKPIFIGLFHKSVHPDDAQIIKPEDSIELMSAMECFLSNNLTVNRVYKRECFSFSAIKRNESMVLNVNYGEKYEQSYLDKFYCKMAVNKLRAILTNSDFLSVF